MKILIADDNETSRKLLNLAFIGKAECEFASMGIEALDVFDQANDAGRPFDLIILDVLMPKMDGLEVLKRIRETEAVKASAAAIGSRSRWPPGLTIGTPF
jgi:two-component system, chemotaxis family, chemotaxis protein CheY